MPYRNKPLIDRGHALLAEAQAAAKKRDAHGMIAALAGSGFIDGLVGRLTARWGRQLGQSEIRDIVAQAIDEAFDAISQGKTVSNLGGWLWKTASNAIADCWQKDHKARVDTGHVDRNYQRPTPITVMERAEVDRHRDQCRDEAIKIARRLLPKIGEGQVRDVMNLVIDAVEQGVPDLPPSQIADTLGIGPDSARTLLSRGFKRLQRAARDEGIEWPDSIAPDDLDDLDALHNHVREQEDSTDAE